MTRNPTTLLALLAAAPAFGQGTPSVAITEYMYSGLDGEFIELTNVSTAPVDLAGWSLDDQTAMAGTFDLSAAGVLAPGQSVVVTDRIAANFIASWNLSGIVVLGGNAVAPFGRNDEIHLFDSAGNSVDVLAYGDEDFPGSWRAQNVSANACVAGLGVNDIYVWTASVVGDVWGSVASVNGDLGNPGAFTSPACLPIGAQYCTSPANSTGAGAVLTIEGSPSIARNLVTLRCAQLPPNATAFFITSTMAGNVAFPGGSFGTLCLGGTIGRYSSSAQNSGAAGAVSLALDLAALSQPGGPVAAMAGETWRFQCWHRDAVLGFPGSNFSSAVEVTFR